MDFVFAQRGCTFVFKRFDVLLIMPSVYLWMSVNMRTRGVMNALSQIRVNTGKRRNKRKRGSLSRLS